MKILQMLINIPEMWFQNVKKMQIKQKWNKNTLQMIWFQSSKTAENLQSHFQKLFEVVFYQFETLIRTLWEYSTTADWLQKWNYTDRERISL